MYIYLSRNEKKPGYIWNLARQSFDSIIRYATANNLSKIEGDDLDMITLKFGQQGINIRQPFGKGVSIPMSYVFVNEPKNDKGNGVSNFRKLLSLSIKVTPKGSVIFAEIESENLPIAIGDTMDNIKNFITVSDSIRKIPGFENIPLALTKLLCDQYVIGGKSHYFEDQVKLILSGVSIGQFAYTYAVPGYEIDTDKKMAIRFTDHYTPAIKPLNEILGESQLVEDFEMLTSKDAVYRLSGTCYNDNVDWPFITKLEFDFADAVQGKLNLALMSKLIMDYNRHAMDANYNLTMADFGLKFVSVKQFEKSEEAGEVSNYLKFFKEVRLIDGYKDYAKMYNNNF